MKNKGGKYHLVGGAPPEASSSSNDAKKKRTMSPEAREKIAAAQRARWAKQKRAK